MELAVGAGGVHAVDACGHVARHQLAKRARVNLSVRPVALPRDDERRPDAAQMAVAELERRGAHATDEAVAWNSRCGRSGSAAPAARSAPHIVTWLADSTGIP